MATSSENEKVINKSDEHILRNCTAYSLLLPFSDKHVQKQHVKENRKWNGEGASLKGRLLLPPCFKSCPSPTHLKTGREKLGSSILQLETRVNKVAQGV